jgi:hypothetical protein
MRKIGAVLVVLAALFVTAARSPEAEWKPLFNGKDLSG